MIRVLFSTMFCGLSIIDNSNGQAFIVDDDMEVLKTYDYEDFSFEPISVVCDYIKLVFKHYKHEVLKPYRKATIKKFLESDYYKDFVEYQKEN